jgi:hypothetical protein
MNYENVEIITNMNELINTLYNKQGIFLFIQNPPPFDISQISDIHSSKCYLLNTKQDSYSYSDINKNIKTIV